MNSKTGILSAFQQEKPIIGVLHLKGEDDCKVLEQTKREIDIYHTQGLDGLLVENYFGNYYQVEQVLDYLMNAKLDIPYGVNCLNLDAMGFHLSNKYNCRYLQIDSVVGHVKPRDEYTLDAFFKMYRESCDAYLMGGVRFKYQPMLSANTTEQDLLIGMERCDAVCVTQDATGQETSLERIRQFRTGLGDFPLFVCAGVTSDNAAQQLRIADGAVVASYFKDNYQDSGDVCAQHVADLMKIVRRVREEKC